MYLTGGIPYLNLVNSTVTCLQLVAQYRGYRALMDAADPKPIPCNVDTDSESDKEPFYWKYTDPTAIPVAHDFPHHLVERVVRARPKPVQGDILDNAFT